MTTDLELLSRWRRGDSEAGNVLFERYFDAICRFFESKVQHDVEELVQKTFLACVKSRDQFRTDSSFRTYLFSIARKQLYRQFRDRHRHGDKLDFGVTSLADLGTGAFGALARNQDRALLLEALCSLPLEQQLLLELYYWETMPVADLAVVFEVPQNTISTRLFRARKALAAYMTRMKDKPRSVPDDLDSLDDWARALRDDDSAVLDSDAVARLRRNQP